MGRPVSQIIGPLALLTASFLVAKVLGSFDLLLAGLLGLFLSAYWKMKGCSYALIALAVLGIIAHLFFSGSHLFRLGCELSFACSFFITALAFEIDQDARALLQSQYEAKHSAMRYLEEEIEKLRENLVQQQMISTEKIEMLQRNMEESLSEKASLEILNDVLRKANANQFTEKTVLEKELSQTKQRVIDAKFEADVLRKEKELFKQSDVGLQHDALLAQLNAARIEKEQTHLINETLVRLHAKENARANEALQKFQKTSEEAKDLRKHLEEMVQDFGETKKQLLSCQVELESVARFRLERDEMVKQLVYAEKKNRSLASIEALHRQLKLQFEEKNRILHETRSALFRADTELETLRIQKKEQDWTLPDELLSQFECLDQELTALQQESEILQDLATHFMSRLPAASGPPAFMKGRLVPQDGQPSIEETLRKALASKKRKRAPKKQTDQEKVAQLPLLRNCEIIN